MTNHSFYVVRDAIDGGALGGVAIAKAVSTNDQLVHCVVVLLLDFCSRVQEVVSQRVELGEVHSQVGDLQLV